MTEHEYMTWFAGFDLGALEDVREYVDAAARQNAADTEDIWACAKATVEMYVDDPDMHKDFDFYRR